MIQIIKAIYACIFSYIWRLYAFKMYMGKWRRKCIIGNSWKRDKFWQNDWCDSQCMVWERRNNYSDKTVPRQFRSHGHLHKCHNATFSISKSPIVKSRCKMVSLFMHARQFGGGGRHASATFEFWPNFSYGFTWSFANSSFQDHTYHHVLTYDNFKLL